MILKLIDLRMDLLRSYELYELLQLYVVSEIAITANRTELYAALFTTLVPKPLDLEEVTEIASVSMLQVTY